MKLIDSQLLDNVSALAKNNERQRMNYNFHQSLDDVLSRLLNAMEPDTYIPPHRHVHPDKEEICIVLRGSLINFTFDDNGTITGKYLLDPRKGVYGMEIEPGVWHCCVILEPDTVVYELKRGPYVPLSADNVAPWAPAVGDNEAIENYKQILLSDKS